MQNIPDIAHCLEIIRILVDNDCHVDNSTKGLTYVEIISTYVNQPLCSTVELTKNTKRLCCSYCYVGNITKGLLRIIQKESVIVTVIRIVIT